jgi:carbamoyltransferase
MKLMVTWGISANSHDAALAVFVGKDLVFASHSERFSGQKNDAHLHKDLINYALKWGQPDQVVWYENPYYKTARQLFAGQGWNWNENDIKHYLSVYGITCPIVYSKHHSSHAAAGYYTSNFSDATIVCIDSIGEFETLTVWKGNGQKLKQLYSQGYPHSVGLWYSAMTQRVGLKPNEDEYILMGMAAYGNPNKLYREIQNDFFDLGKNRLVTFKQNLHRGCLDWRKNLKGEQAMFDIAAATQKNYEDIFRWVIARAAKMNNSRNLVLMGGCALNCSANHIAYDYFDNVWIMPNPGDAGSAVGAVLAHWKEHIIWDSPYLGYDITGDYPIEELITELKKTGIAGVANGKAEFGPRALGNRSLLADPRGSDIKDRVNTIKQRQKFRPFAPVILEEYAKQYFDGPVGPYMQYTARCKDPDSYPAIVHADGTSRVQTVAKGDRSGIRLLLERWYKETGCPMLLNTSLNIKGKPMVNDLTDAEEFAKLYNIKVFTSSK